MIPTQRSESVMSKRRNPSPPPGRDVPSPQDPYTRPRISLGGPFKREPSSNYIRSSRNPPPTSSPLAYEQSNLPLLTPFVNFSTQSLLSDDPNSKRMPATLFSKIEETNAREAAVESFLIQSAKTSINLAIEQTLQIHFSAKSVFFWQDIPSILCLYCSSTSTLIRGPNGILTSAIFTRKVTYFNDASKDLQYNPSVDSSAAPPGSRVLIIPLCDANRNLFGFAEVVREPSGQKFTKEDEEFSDYFAKKFQTVSQWLIQPKFPHKAILELMQAVELEQYLIIFQRTMKTIFSCVLAEIWTANYDENLITRYSNSSTQIPIKDGGIVCESLKSGFPINCTVNKMQSSYNPDVDGDSEMPIVCCPLKDDRIKRRYCVALRGRKGTQIYTSDDEKMLISMMPYLALSIENTVKWTDANHHLQEKGNAVGIQSALKESFDMEGTKSIIDSAMESLQKLLNSTKSLLLVYNQQSGKLKSVIHGGLRQPLELDPQKGLYKKCFLEGKIVNLSDAYEDPDFDSSFDLQTGFRTVTLLYLPIKNTRKKIFGMAQFLNKTDGNPYSTVDIQTATTFCGICGVFLENEHLFDEYTKNSLNYQSLLDIATSFSGNLREKEVLTKILNSAKIATLSEKGSIFLKDEVKNALITYISDSELPAKIPVTNGIAASTVATKQPIICNDPYHDPRFNKLVDYSTHFKTKNICCSPLISENGTALGAIEVLNKNDQYNIEDQIELNAISVLICRFLELRKAKDISKRGHIQVEVEKWVDNFDAMMVPEKLVLLQEQKQVATSLAFSAIDWNGIGLFKVAFNVFSSFGLLKKFKISAGKLFTFLFSIKEKYNEVPFHNWIHAVDVLQSIHFLILQNHLDSTLSDVESFALCVSALSHDIGHKGTDNQFQISASTPIGQLYKENCNEMRSCSLLQNLSDVEDLNIFLNVSEPEKAWSLIIRLIQSIDMVKYSDLIKKAGDLLQMGPINLQEEQHRMIALRLLFCLADTSFLWRNFETADKWLQLLQEEEYRQGDMEDKLGIPHSFAGNDRKAPKYMATLDFFERCISQLYQISTRIFPDISVCFESMKANMKQWREASQKDGGL